MSIILDALKKAQEERKKITQMSFPKLNSGKSAGGQKWIFYGVAGGLVCLILVVLFYPAQKKPTQIQTVAVNNLPVAVAVPPKVEASAKIETPSKVEAQAKVEAPSKVEANSIPSVKNDTKIPPVAKIAEEQSSQLKKQPEAEKKPAAYVPKPKATPRKQMQDTGKTMLPQEGAKVVVKKADDEKIMDIFNEAVEEAKNGRFEVAKGLYLSVLEEKPDYIEAINNLGVIAMKQGNLKEALSSFRKCLAVKKDYSKAYNNIGLVLMAQDDTKGAEEYFKKSIEIDKDKIEPYVNLAAILRGEKRYDDASMMLESLVNRQAKDASLFLSLALVKDESGKYSDAIKYYRYYLNTGGTSKERNAVINRLKVLEENQATANR